MMSNKEIIAVVQAKEDGAKIQLKLHDEQEWSNCVEEPRWNFYKTDYRIKPEPQHCYGHMGENGIIGSTTWIDRETAFCQLKIRFGENNAIRVVKLIPAPDDE